MSDEEPDPARDPVLAGALRRLPAPPLPDGLADRIVRNAVRRPQQAESPPPAAEPRAERLGGRRWLRYGSGGAAAAGLLAALVFANGLRHPMPAPSAVRPPQAALEEPAAEPRPDTAPAPPLAVPGPIDGASRHGHAPPPEAPANTAPQAVPRPVGNDEPEAGLVEPGLVGPAGSRGRATMPQSAPAPELGITGGGAGLPAQRRGGG